MFALEVKEELAAWPEQENRERRWVSITTVIAFVCVVYVLIRDSTNSQLNVKEALELCRYEWMQSALEEFLRVMTEDGSTKEESLSPSGISKRRERQFDSRYCFVVN